MGKTSYIFPSDMGVSSVGGTFALPFVHIEFYQWKSQNTESNDRANLQSEIVADFFFAMPEQTIMEDFGHKWDPTYDWANLGRSLLSKGASYAIDVLRSRSQAFDAVANFASASIGIKINDYVAETYDGMDFRQFDFLFNLVPRTKKESETIRQIVKSLKTLTTPNYYDSTKFQIGEEGSFFNVAVPGVAFPHVCKIYVYAGNMIKLYETMLSGVQKLTFSYANAGPMKTFTDGYPVNTQINLSVKELRRATLSTIGV
jgi:hypothetical protein